MASINSNKTEMKVYVDYDTDLVPYTVDSPLNSYVFKPLVVGLITLLLAAHIHVFLKNIVSNWNK